MEFMKLRCKYEEIDASFPRRVVWIIDLNRVKSVTNDAEAVCFVLNQKYPGFRIIYRDTMGKWDELVHEDGKFIRFAPIVSD